MVNGLAYWAYLFRFSVEKYKMIFIAGNVCCVCVWRSQHNPPHTWYVLVLGLISTTIYYLILANWHNINQLLEMKSKEKECVWEREKDVLKMKTQAEIGTGKMETLFCSHIARDNPTEQNQNGRQIEYLSHATQDNDNKRETHRHIRKTKYMYGPNPKIIKATWLINPGDCDDEAENVCSAHTNTSHTHKQCGPESLC